MRIVSAEGEVLEVGIAFVMTAVELSRGIMGLRVSEWTALSLSSDGRGSMFRLCGHDALVEVFPHSEFRGEW